MSLYNSAPAESTWRLANKSTLIFSWWTTIFSAALILTRVVGRRLKISKLYAEDWIALWGLVPLFLRMGQAHLVLEKGTNNVEFPRGLSAVDVLQRTFGSKVVIGTRIMFAMYLWTIKLSTSEFMNRIFRQSRPLRGISFLRIFQGFLAITFLGTIAANFLECRPTDHLWLVTPSPAPQCRQGFGSLIVFGVTDFITDLALVLYPVPLIVQLRIPLAQRAYLIFLFSFPTLPMALSLVRVFMIIDAHGKQSYRTVWADLIILTSTLAANLVIVGSFIRENRTKPAKFRPGTLQRGQDLKAKSGSSRTGGNGLLSKSDEDLLASDEQGDTDRAFHLQNLSAPEMRTGKAIAVENKIEITEEDVGDGDLIRGHVDF